MLAFVLGSGLGVLLGGGILFFWSRIRINQQKIQLLAQFEATRVELATKASWHEQTQTAYKTDLAHMRDQHTLALTQTARLEAQLQASQEDNAEKMRLLDDAKQRLSDIFQSLSAEALHKNNASFLELAKSALLLEQQKSQSQFTQKEQAISALVSPMQQALTQVDQKLQQLETERVRAYEGLHQQIRFLRDSNDQLRNQTSQLVQSLKSSTVRGRWGELQLRRVVELAGMLQHCDFVEQSSKQTEDKRVRPDMLIQLPGNKMLVVDAKAPLEAFLHAIEATDEFQKQHLLTNHANHLRAHIKALSAKAYWQQFERTPEFVVLFLPGESFFSAALQQDPELIELGVAQNIILATPTTLIALLKTVAYGWKQENIAETAEKISKLGHELYQRLWKVSEHLADVGKSLGNSVKSYNDALGSLESRVIVTARKLKELHLGDDSKDLPDLHSIDQIPRALPAVFTDGPPSTSS